MAGKPESQPTLDLDLALVPRVAGKPESQPTLDLDLALVPRVAGKPESQPTLDLDLALVPRVAGKPESQPTLDLDLALVPRARREQVRVEICLARELSPSAQPPVWQVRVYDMQCDGQRSHSQYWQTIRPVDRTRLAWHLLVSTKIFYLSVRQGYKLW